MKVREIGGTLHIVLVVCAEEVYDPNENLYGRYRTFAGFLSHFDPIMYASQKHAKVSTANACATTSRHARRAKFQAKSRARKKNRYRITINYFKRNQ